MVNLHEKTILVFMFYCSFSSKAGIWRIETSGSFNKVLESTSFAQVSHSYASEKFVHSPVHSLVTRMLSEAAQLRPRRVFSRIKSWMDQGSCRRRAGWRMRRESMSRSEPRRGEPGGAVRTRKMEDSREVNGGVQRPGSS